MRISRRHFLAASAAALASASVRGDTNKRPRIAFLGTAVYRLSHAQHFLDRLTQGYTWGGRWAAPRLEVAGIFLDQFPEGTDLGRERIARYGLKQFPSVAEALTLGGKELAVDGVVLIGEHGNYPVNDRGQTLYPRYKWFQEIVKVFEASGRSVPVFNDKHLSTDWKECCRMVDDSRRLDFPFLAGSSLPVTWRLPAIDLPFDAPLRESVCVAYGGIDSYDIHALETAQCMSERRRGGEVGIRSVHALKDERVYEYLAQPENATTRRLFESALCCSHTLPADDGYPTAPVSLEWARRELPQITSYLIEHRDGFRTAIFLTGIRDFNYAGLIDHGSSGDRDEVIACQMYLPMPGRGATTADFFNPLTRHIEDLVLERRTPYPLERTLLTSGMVIAGVESLYRGEVRVDTPEMEVVYQGTQQSQFRRE